MELLLMGGLVMVSVAVIVIFIASRQPSSPEAFEQKNHSTINAYRDKMVPLQAQVNNRRTDLQTKLDCCKEALSIYEDLKNFCSTSDAGLKWYASNAEQFVAVLNDGIRKIENDIAIEKQQKEKILSFFHTEGWDIWSDEIHDQKGQADRIQRSYEQTFKILAYNSNARLSLLSGTKGDNYFVSPFACTCPDFKKRGLPCKHLYYMCRVSASPDFSASSKIPANGLHDIRCCLAGKFSYGTHATVKALLETYGASVKSSLFDGIPVIVEGKNVTEATVNKAIDLQIMQIKEDDLFSMLEVTK